MFVRVKHAGKYDYLQLVENRSELEALSTRRIGPALVFGRLWKELGWRSRRR